MVTSCVENFQNLVYQQLSNILLTLISMLYILSSELMLFITWSLYLLTIVTCFPHPPSPNSGNHQSFLCFYEFSFCLFSFLILHKKMRSHIYLLPPDCVALDLMHQNGGMERILALDSERLVLLSSPGTSSKLLKASEPLFSVLYHRDIVIHSTDCHEDRFACVNI